MPLSMFQASVPALIRNLTIIGNLLAKGAADAQARKIDPGVFLNARLAPDMFPLIRQVQIATDISKGGASRLAGVEIPSYADDETTFEQLQARLAKTIAYLNTLTAGQIDGSEQKPIELKVGGRELKFTGQDYLFAFVLPNVYFHATTTYAILRHNGVKLGKTDFIDPNAQG